MAGKYTVELDDEVVASMVRDELDWHIGVFDNDIALAEAGKKYMVTFHHNRKTDIACMKKMRKAMQLVRTYYSVANERTEAWIDKVHEKTMHRSIQADDTIAELERESMMLRARNERLEKEAELREKGTHEGNA